jgi:TRAP-type mannitol/chloroaromatic compound transport system permease small subunit
MNREEGRFSMNKDTGKLIKITKFVDIISEKVGKLFSWLLIFLILSMTYEIFARYFFNSPTMWSYDVSYMLSSLILVMGVAWVLAERGHVSVDILYSKFPTRGRAFLDIFFSLVLFFPCWILVIVYMFPEIAFSWSSAEKASVGTWRPMLAPFKTSIFLGLLLFVVQGVIELIKNVKTLISGENL